MKKILKTVFLFILLISLLLFITNCNDDTRATIENDEAIQVETEIQEETEEEVETDDTSQVLEEGFIADGVIGSKEYTNSLELDGFMIYWSIDDEYLFMAMQAATEGYVSVGLDPSDKMKDADMVFGYVVEGQATVLDLYSTGDFGPHPPDEELGGTDDILEYGGMEADGYTTIEFKRLLMTGDEYDNDISKGTMSIIWALGNADDLDRSHSKRGSGEITIE